MPQPGVSAQARRMARSCCLNSSGRLRETRMPRQPRKGFGSGVSSRSPGQLVASGIQRAEDDAVGGAAFRPVFCNSASALLHPACPDGLPSRKNSVRNSPTPSAPTSLMPEYSWGNSTLTESRMLRPSRVTVGRSRRVPGPCTPFPSPPGAACSIPRSPWRA